MRLIVLRILAIAMALGAGAVIQTAFLHLFPKNFTEEEFLSTGHWILVIVQGVLYIVLVAFVVFDDPQKQSNKK